MDEVIGASRQAPASPRGESTTRLGRIICAEGAGMAVPDWPNTFGYNMFLFPVSRWVGGIFYEHSHRLIASGIGLMTVILSIALWRVEPRRWVRILGLCAVVGVCLQGLLGGLRVVLIKDEIGVFHALLAQSFFVALALLAVTTGRRFVQKRWADYEPHPTLRWWAFGATALIFLQLGIAATMRHEHIGLSIPDFPLAYGSWLPDTSPEAMERINAERLAAGEMKTNALQIWIQMAHRILAVLTPRPCWYFSEGKACGSSDQVLVDGLDCDDSCADWAWRLDNLVQ
jgi:cytochrome c oxidase assembly protein subunit 15